MGQSRSVAIQLGPGKPEPSNAGFIRAHTLINLDVASCHSTAHMKSVEAMASLFLDASLLTLLRFREGSQVRSALVFILLGS
jgi:hypothetical protein